MRSVIPSSVWWFKYSNGLGSVFYGENIWFMQIPSLMLTVEKPIVGEFCVNEIHVMQGVGVYVFLCLPL